MIASPFPPCSSSPSTPNTYSFPQTHWVSPLPSPFHAAVTSIKIKNLLSVVHAIANNRISSPELTLTTTAAAGQKFNSDDHNLLTLLRQRKTDEAWTAYTQCAHLPNPTCLSRLVCQLSHRNTPESLSRAQSILTRLRHERQLHRLDANSLGLLAVTAAKAGQTLYATSVINSMLRSGYLPHVKAWSAVVSRLAASGDDGPATALKLFTAITTRIRSFPDPAGAIDSKPDTAAYNAALNACANLGDRKQFRQLFDEMPQFGLEPDVLTFNIMIKLCARANRKDLLVSVLEMILMKGIDPCITTLHSLVAAFVGFGDLETAEKVVQAMREGRRDICKILRHSNIKENSDKEEEDPDEGDPDEVFDKLLPLSNPNPPLFPKPFHPDTRIYTTLMKGYMKFGRVADMVRMLDAMHNQENSSSHPDHVSYTTVVSALVKGGSMDQAREVLYEMGRVGVPANRITYNILLKGYCQQLQMDKAKELFDEMIAKNIEPDVISYNTIIDGCILGDDSASALKYFNEMRARKIAPSKVSYTTLMKAFAMSGQPKIAHRVFDEMSQDPRIKVDLVAWNMLVKGYSRLGLVEEVKRVIEKMKENGFSPDVATYGSLVNAIAIARKPGEALLLWNEIKESGFKPDEGILEGLADICVRAALFKKALEIVACMEENGIAPNKTKYKKMYVEMHSRMFTSKHASQARVARRSERKRAAEAFKFWLGLPNSYYASEWHFGDEDD